MNESLLRTALAPARELEPTDAEVQRALRPRRRRRAHVFLAALTATIVIGGTAYAIGPVRGALGTFAPWIDNDAPPPGQAVDHAPGWPNVTSPRVIAEAGGVRLIVAREGKDRLAIALGDTVGESGTIKSFQEMFSDHDVVVLGPGSIKLDQTFDDQWRRPLFGITSKLVTRVELTYASGPPTVADGLQGGFVLLADAMRPLRELIAYDAAGRELERVDETKMELRVCREVRGCPPGKLEPSRP
jgi:hypothetical protein